MKLACQYQYQLQRYKVDLTNVKIEFDMLKQQLEDKEETIEQLRVRAS